MEPTNLTGAANTNRSVTMCEKSLNYAANGAWRDEETEE
jgi:hypothetical protein